MKRKMFAMLLSLAMLFTLAPTAFATDSTERNESQSTTMSGNCGAPAEEGGEVTDAVKWSFDSDTGTLTISGNGAMADYTVNPSKEVDTRPWSDYKATITEVSISEGITSIGDSAFRSMTVLKKANIPASITDLGDHIFRGDTSLTTVEWAGDFKAPTIKDTDSNHSEYTGTYVPTSMFDGCVSLGNNVELSDWLPSSFTGMGCAAFRGTQFTVNFDAWSNLNYIGAYAFSEMPNLDSFTLTDKITIGFRGDASNAFTESGLKSLTVNVETVPERFAFSANKLAKIVLTDRVKNVGKNAFYGTAITELVVPSGVEKLGEWSFLKCSSLKKLTLLGEITLEGVQFPGTPLEELVIDKDAVVTCTDDPFRGTGSYPAMTSLKKVSILGTFISSSADKDTKTFWKCFSRNADLTEVVLSGENAINFSRSAFPNVTTLSILGGEATFPGYTLGGDSKLEQVTIDVEKYSSQSSSFRYAKNLKTFRLKADSANLDDRAFVECPSLMAVDLTECGSIIYSDGTFSSMTTTGQNNAPMSPTAIIYVSNTSANPKTSTNSAGLSASHGIVAITNGGTFPEDTKFTSGTLATPTKEGYIFGGWYSDSNFGTAVTDPTAGQTYYAKWVSKITFDANGGEGSMTTQEITEGDTTTTLTENSFTKTGYTFSGWNTAVDGSGTSYTDQATGAGANGNITLYAQWTKKIGESTTYTVNAILDQTYTGAAITPAVVVKNGDTVLTSGYTVAYSNNTNVGIAKVTVAVGSDTAEVEFKIVKDEKPTVEMADVSVTYGTEYTMTATAKTSAGNEITGENIITIQYYTKEDCTQGETNTAPTNAGTYYAKATLTGTYNYVEATKIAKITISNATFSVKATGYSDTYDGQAHSITVAAEGASVTYSTDGTNYSEANPTFTDAGTYNVYYKATKANHDDVIGSATVKIAKVQTSLTLTADPASRTGAGTVNLTVSSTGIPETATISAPACEGVTVSPNSDGTYSVSLPNETKDYTFTVSYADDGNHEAATATCTVSVTRRSSGGGTTTYTVTTDSAKNGSVSVSPKNASKGTAVTITVKPDSGYELDKLTITDKNGEALKLTDKGDGQYTFTMPDGKVEVKAVFVKKVETRPFGDVSADAYYNQAVQWAQEKGITDGISNDLFGPDQPCTRSQIVTFLWRAAGSPEPKSTAAGMTDVVPGSYYAKAVAWAVENGITTGTAEGTFSPDATCTRAQAVTFLARAQNAKATGKTAFSDVPADSYFADAIAWAQANGVTTGTSETTFSPDNDCTRAQIVTFLYRANQGT
ncbi:MAG: leucine-rich repeat protein [Firmicutes bacterium]|nr:leucine-rich repeat protein [Bacillota bacterium]